MKKLLYSLIIFILLGIVYLLSSTPILAHMQTCSFYTCTYRDGSTANGRMECQSYNEADDHCSEDSLRYCIPTVSCEDEDIFCPPGDHEWCRVNGGVADACAPLPQECAIPFCSWDGTCGVSCRTDGPCAPTATPTPPLVFATSTPGPTPTPATNLTCEQIHGDFDECGVCHGWDPRWTPGATGTCQDFGDGCCIGNPGPGPTPPGCYVGKACGGACGAGGVGSCDECNDGWCNGGQCSSCEPPDDPTSCIPPAFACQGFTAFNASNAPDPANPGIPSSFARGLARGQTYLPVPLSSTNTVTVDPGDIVWFSTFKGGVNSPASQMIMSSEGNQHVRTQYITRQLGVVTGATNTNDIIGSCLMVAGQFRVNWCLDGDSKIGFNSRLNSDWPWGQWPYDYLTQPTDYSFNTPDVVPAPTFSETRVESGITRVFSGTCNLHDQKHTCCAISRLNPGSPPGVPEQYRCTDPAEGDACNSRAFWPMSCRFNDNGHWDVAGQLAKSRTMRKQFNTPGEYLVEATEQFSCEGGQNNRNPCVIRVVVQNPNATITGRLINDNNGNGSIDDVERIPAGPAGAADLYTGTASISVSPNPGGAITTAWNAATGTYTLGNVPQGATYTITITGIPAQRYFSSNVQTDTIARIVMPVPAGSTALNAVDTAVSRFYTISGVVYNDKSKNRVRDGTPLEPVYTGGNGTVTGPNGTVNVNAAGAYTLTNIKPGTLNTIFYNNTALDEGYIIFVNAYSNIGVGTANPPIPACPGISTPASCAATSWPGVVGDVINLNFAVTNSLAWMQFTGLDVRVDSGFENPIPENVHLSCRDARVVSGNPGYTSVSSYP